tara:strand:+ start:80 stop:514 length:435 start_codon:yes stop_codon:yes gene_type:complete
MKKSEMIINYIKNNSQPLIIIICPVLLWFILSFTYYEYDIPYLDTLVQFLCIFLVLYGIILYNINKECGKTMMKEQLSKQFGESISYVIAAFFVEFIMEKLPLFEFLFFLIEDTPILKPFLITFITYMTYSIGLFINSMYPPLC